jgi:hypothetical protein
MVAIAGVIATVADFYQRLTGINHIQLCRCNCVDANHENTDG